MLYNSLPFAIFFPVVFLLYWFACNRNLKIQNALILVASYVFYGWWDWRFLFLVIFSSAVDFMVAQALHKTTANKQRKWLLIISLLVNLGLLGFFKYYNFFVASFVDGFSAMGIELHSRTLSIILPVGISFYTFQTLSYTIDVYRRKLEPTKDILAFFAYVSFFPQLVAGPIERAANLIPQFKQKRTFDYHQGVDGMRQILLGFVKKIVVADNCAVYVDQIFGNYQNLPASALFMGAIFFAFQIYGDFSGYSDIAIGTARLLGFNLMTNFRVPYFSRDIAEFWRRWHISLSTWFRDYVYIPLGGSKGGKWKSLRNVFVIFIVSGFWHGANWTFIVWGALNALYFIPLLFLNKNRQHLDVVAKGRFWPGPGDALKIISTFLLTCFAWIFFRADNLTMAFDYIGHLFDTSFFTYTHYVKYLFYIAPLVLLEWVNRGKEHALQIHGFHKMTRQVIYYTILLTILFFGYTGEKSFIYFQF